MVARPHRRTTARAASVLSPVNLQTCAISRERRNGLPGSVFAVSPMNVSAFFVTLLSDLLVEEPVSYQGSVVVSLEDVEVFFVGELACVFIRYQSLSQFVRVLVGLVYSGL